MSDMECRKCHEVKPFDLFPRAKTRLGYDTVCKACRAGEKTFNSNMFDAKRKAQKVMKKYIGGWERVESISAEAREHGMSYGKWKAEQRRKHESSL